MARDVLHERKARGLAAGMQFTYRNPDRSTDPRRILPTARTLVVGARRYVRRPPDGVEAPAGTPARIGRYAWSDHYALLRDGLEAVARELRAAGFTARVVADDNALVDRAAAHRAGLGWFGRNTNLLLEGAGSWFVLGSVVTDAGLPTDEPVGDGCGPCRRCVDGCPTGALTTEGALDARRCLAWLLQAPGTFPPEHREAVGDRIYGCDTCQEVCPVNRLDARRSAPTAAEASATPVLDAVELLRSDDASILARWGRWYIAERDPRWLRRNALLVLGNTGDPADPEVVAAVDGALRHPDAVLRAHAVWAAARLGRTDLLAAVSGDDDPGVRAEVTGVSAVMSRSDASPADVTPLVPSPVRT